MSRMSCRPSLFCHYAIPKGLYTDEELSAAGLVSYDTPSLKNGSKGESVKQLQEKLLALGYSLPRYGADGSFGAETERAVKLFQQDNGLTVDGIAGKLTLAALDKAVENEADPVLYTLTIPNLDEAQMKALIAQYPAALVVKST